MALYHKWDVKNGFTYVIQFFSLISDDLGGVELDKYTVAAGVLRQYISLKRKRVIRMLLLSAGKCKKRSRHQLLLVLINHMTTVQPILLFSMKPTCLLWCFFVVCSRNLKQHMLQHPLIIKSSTVHKEQKFVSSKR